MISEGAKSRRRFSGRASVRNSLMGPAAVLPSLLPRGESNNGENAGQDLAVGAKNKDIL